MAETETAAPSQRPSRRALKRIATTERILAAAKRLIVEDGYEGLTIAKLAGELGYAVGALYRYFKGKDAILAALQVQVIEQIREDMDVVAAGTDQLLSELDLPEGEAALLHVIAHVGVYESLTRRRPTDYRLLALSIGDPRELLTREMVDAGSLPVQREVLARVAARIAQAQAHGVLREGDALRRTVILWGATQGVMQLRKLARFDPGFGGVGLADELVRSTLVGWGAGLDRVQALQDHAHGLVERLPTSD